jgi:hypothetical protein
MSQILIIAVALIVTSSASAKTASGTVPAPPPIVVFKKSEEHKFSGLKLKGQLKKPDLSYIYKRRGLKAEQIVNIPENFNREILEGTGQF